MSGMSNHMLALTGGEAPALWTPADITTALWYDAADPATVTVNPMAMTQVTDWDDKSGNARHATQGTSARQPFYDTTVMGGIGAIQFNGTKSMRIPGDSVRDMLRNIGEVTITSVVLYSSFPSALNTVAIFPTPSNGFARSLLASTSGARASVGGRRLDANSFQSVTGSVVTLGTTNPHIQIGILDYANSDAYLYTDGQSDGSSTTFQTSGNTSDTRSDDSNSLGATQVGASLASPLNGYIGEIVVTLTAMDTTTREKLEGYYAHKWGVTLPMAHPYFSSPPTV